MEFYIVGPALSLGCGARFDRKSRRDASGTGAKCFDEFCFVGPAWILRCGASVARKSRQGRQRYGRATMLRARSLKDGDGEAAA